MAIHEKEWTHHVATFNLYKNMELFRKCIHGCNMSPWWIHASHCPDQRYKVTLLMKLLVGVQALENDDMYRMVRQCSSCTGFIQSTVTHMLFDCPGLMPSRNMNLKNLKNCVLLGSYMILMHYRKRTDAVLYLVVSVVPIL